MTPNFIFSTRTRGVVARRVGASFPAQDYPCRVRGGVPLTLHHRISRRLRLVRYAVVDACRAVARFFLQPLTRK